MTPAYVGPGFSRTEPYTNPEMKISVRPTALRPSIISACIEGGTDAASEGGPLALRGGEVQVRVVHFETAGHIIDFFTGLLGSVVAER